MLALELAMGLLLGLGLFQRDQLGFGQHQAILGALGFKLGLVASFNARVATSLAASAFQA
jgi:hypothetical protein